MHNRFIIGLLSLALLFTASCGGSDDETSSDAGSDDGHSSVGNEVIAAQREALAAAYKEAPFGPQAPRDIDSTEGTNPVTFDVAPPYTEMNLCNIHFHEGAEHKGGNYTSYAGNGDGAGYGTGYVYDGELSEAELAAFDGTVGGSEHGDLVPGDTIEIHYVHSTDPIEPGPTLGSCLAGEDASPQLRVEAQVFVLVNDDNAPSLMDLTAIEQVNGLYQAVNLPNDTGSPIQYAGSTTGPSYNEKGSPFMVSWSVRPDVMKVSIASVEEWLNDNVFDETYAHGVRNLVQNPELLSPIG